eukprot:14429581-Alexandrium_andersonii.AAC.1
MCIRDRPRSDSTERKTHTSSLNHLYSAPAAFWISSSAWMGAPVPDGTANRRDRGALRLGTESPPHPNRD